LPSSSAASPRTGPTPTPWPRTAVRARR
jgi:hypothetical protein